MLNSILNYSRLALLGIAMAFVINPYAYGSGWPGSVDVDDDSVQNHEDPCPENSYYNDSHARCLEDAGVVIINFQQMMKDALEEASEDYLSAPISVAEIAIRALQWVVARVAGRVPPTSFEDAAIKRCKGRYGSLNKYRLHLDSFVRSLKNMRNLAAFLAGIFAFGKVTAPLAAIFGAIAAATQSVIDIYQPAATSTGNAYHELCLDEDREYAFRK